MNHKELYNLLKTVKKNIRCPQCGKPYDFSQIKIRGIADQIIFLELNCSGHMPVLATVAYNGKKIVQNEKQEDAINPDDVINTYKFLKDFSGGFEKVFNNPKKIK